MRRSEIGTYAYRCYYEITVHKLVFREDDCFRVWTDSYKPICTTSLSAIYNTLGELFRDKGELMRS
jgi:hypothetical protein